MGTSPIVLSLCDYTGVMVEPWAEAGYECWIVDIQHKAGVVRTKAGITRVGADILSYLPPRREYAAVFGFPPCTNFAVSGARWFKEKGLSGLSSAAALVERTAEICAWSGAPWMIENPIGTLSTYWRDPDYRFDPCDFGGYDGGEDDTYTKRTCLWTSPDFVMPEPKRIEPTEGSRMHFIPPGPDRANLRSATPRGFARAVFEANALR